MSSFAEDLLSFNSRGAADGAGPAEACGPLPRCSLFVGGSFYRRCVANTAVWHAKYRIELDLTDEPHLGHPDRPGLLDEVYPTPGRGLLQCPQCRDYGDPDCPEWMHLRRRDGRLHAVHFNIKIKDHGASESDAHK